MTGPGRDLRGALGDLQLDAAELDSLVDAALGARPRPVDLARLTPAQADQHHRDLDSWVRRIVRRYTVDHREIPPCWAQHGDLLEELSALYTAHQAAFDRSGPATGPSDWHHTFAMTRARLQVAVSRTGCRPDQHRPPMIPHWSDDDR